MKKTITSSSLSIIGGLEKRLAREESERSLQSLPAGHPLLSDIKAEEAKSGDLAGLPETHPIKIELKAAQERYEAAQARKDEDAIANEGVKLRRVRKLTADATVREQQRLARDTEEERKQAAKDTYRACNLELDKTIIQIDSLLARCQQVFDYSGDDRFAKVKVTRLDRTMRAAKSILSDSKLKTIGI